MYGFEPGALARRNDTGEILRIVSVFPGGMVMVRGGA